ncbi:MAG: 50S ribosomal protein L15 [Burkholderiales bacterium]|jgi:large subunit ribosomal protein L15|nr:50S ribosomal protein L15 [Pseudomonadota bacterium]MDA1011489.1 50S ribosomal protein L15 [Pseudomonadota bacterium]
MRLNDISPADGSKKDRMRVGRGGGSGKGKTAGRGHKGQHSRAGGYHKVGFEGGQMPMARRLPKRGFRSMTSADTREVRLDELNKVDADVIDLAALKAAQVVPNFVSAAKVFLSGSLAEGRKPQLKGILVSKGARLAIESAGGKIED